MDIVFNQDRILDLINGKLDSDKKKEVDEKEFAPVSFLPEGQHKIRIFFDPLSNLVREYLVHQFGNKRTLCPQGCVGDDIPVECQIHKLHTELDVWRYKARWECISYGKILETNSPSKYWKEGNVGVIISDRGWKFALKSISATMLKDARDFFLTSLNPFVEGGYYIITVFKDGKLKKINIAAQPPGTKYANPVFKKEDVPGWFKSLDEVWVPKKFDIKRYDSVIREIFVDLKRRRDELKIETINKLKVLISNDVYLTNINDSINREMEEKQSGNSTNTDNINAMSENEKSIEDNIISNKSSTIKKEKVMSEDCKEIGKYNPNSNKCLVCDNNIECIEKIEEVS